MKPTFIKKNTQGSAAGIQWEAGDVKPLDPRLAEELVKLSPDDYEVVQEGEHTHPAPVHNHQGTDFLRIEASGDGVNIQRPSTSVVEVEVSGSAEENAAVAATLKEVTKPTAKKPTQATQKKAKETSAE